MFFSTWKCFPYQNVVQTESSTKISSEAENHGSVIKIDSDQQTDSKPCFLTPGFGEFEVMPIMSSNLI